MGSLVQNLWRSPLRGVTMVIRSALHGIQVLSDLSEAKIRDARMTGVVYEDIWLAGGSVRQKNDIQNNHVLP